MIYGYARVSTAQQSIERQIRNIKESYPEAVIVAEAFTGTTTERPKWQRLAATVKAGDLIVFDSVSRMSRDAAEGYAAYEQLHARRGACFSPGAYDRHGGFPARAGGLCAAHGREYRSDIAGDQRIFNGAGAGANSDRVRPG